MLTSNTFPNIRRHYMAIVLAMIVGVLCVAPPMYFALHTPDFASIQMIGADAEDHYVARINQVYVGFPDLGNTFLPNKNTPYVQPWLGENLAARLGMLLNISAPEVNVLSKFIFPFLAAMLVYSLAYILFKSRGAALISTGVVMLGDGLLSGPAAWLALIHGLSINNDFLNFARPINPEISALLFFGTLICIYKIFLTDQKIRWYMIALCGALTGAALYVSIFIFTFLVTVQTLCFVWLIYKRDFNRARGVLIIGAMNTILITPFFINYLHLVSSPWYNDVLMRNGLSSTHAPIIGLWIPIMLFLLAFFTPERFRTIRPFFIITTLALLILLNQQVITGHVVQPGHYHWYITMPLAGVLLGMYAAALFEFLFRQKALKYAAYVICMLILLYNAVTTQISSYKSAFAATVQAQRYSPALNYLNSLPDRRFIWSNNDISGNVSIYTKHDNATTHQALNYLIPKSYFENVLFLNYRLRGIGPKVILDTMKKERSSVSSAIYALYWREQAGDFAAIPDSEIYSLAMRYISEYSKPIEKFFEELGIDIIIWDKSSEPLWKIDQIPLAQKIYTSGSIDVYQIIK